jgi:hypothetical protein
LKRRRSPAEQDDADELLARVTADRRADLDMVFTRVTQMRRSDVLAIVAAAVTVMLLGGWLLLNQREPNATGTGSSDPAPLTELRRPSGGHSSSPRPDPYPRVPSAQIKNGDRGSLDVRTAENNRQLLVPVFDTDCGFDEVRLLAEHGDRVEIEIRHVVKPKPATVTAAPDGSYGCVSYQPINAPKHAVITLRAPLGQRDIAVVNL